MASAVRRAVSRAAAVVPTSPSANTNAPHPARTHQPALLAITKFGWSAPCNEADTSDHTTATPRVCPIWREVEAIAAATPAWARGIPETAVVVMGAFTNPNPIPNTT